VEDCFSFSGLPIRKNCIRCRPEYQAADTPFLWRKAMKVKGITACTRPKNRPGKQTDVLSALFPYIQTDRAEMSLHD
jgi:hypothetical protein